MKSRTLSLALLALAPAVSFAEQTPAAAGPSAAEVKLRDALRTATLRLRTLESDLESARSAVETKDKEIVLLRKKAESEARRAAEEIALGAKHMTALNEKITKITARAKALDESNDKWKAEATRLADTLRATEAERARLATLSDRLTLRVADRERHNVELIRIGGEILTRFEQYGLGEAIAGKDTFIGTKRVKLLGLVQEYTDKIDDNKVIPGKPCPEELSAESAPGGPVAVSR